MIVDLISVAFLGMLALLGWISGFWSQVVRLVALVAAYVLSKPLGELLYPPMSPWLGRSPWVGTIAATAIAFVFCYGILAIIGWMLLRSWRQRRPYVKSGLDSLFGALLGAAKGGVIIAMVLSALALIDHTPAATVLESVGWRDSFSAKQLRDHNLLEDVRLPVVGDVKTLRRLSRDPSLRRRVAEDPAVRKLLRHKKVRPLMRDEKLRVAAQRGDLRTLLADPRVAALMRDPELRKLAERIDLSKLQAGKRGKTSKKGKAPPLPSST
ncbi:MAG: hypothetical protein CSA65_05895 [Proteobacteria bacterium]|nr:MAG: hypothetical protein CSA65_05895 [Pseudomonadota bacterium]